METLYGLMYCLKAPAEYQRLAQADVEVVRTDWSAGLLGKELSSVLIHAGRLAPLQGRGREECRGAEEWEGEDV